MIAEPSLLIEVVFWTVLSWSIMGLANLIGTASDSSTWARAHRKEDTVQLGTNSNTIPKRDTWERQIHSSERILC
jgi:hypothetical protein